MQRESTGATKPTPFAKTQLDHTPAHARPALYRSAMIVLMISNVKEILTNVLHTPHAKTRGVHTAVPVGLGLKEMVEYAKISTNAKGRQTTAQIPDLLEIVPTPLAPLSVLVP